MRELAQIDAGELNVGYTDDGPSDGPPVLLLHGWPYDIHSFADVLPLLAAAGHRVLVPFVRGYGTTRFLRDDTPRNGQQAAVAADVVAFLDALGIERAVLAGFDWGARSARRQRRPASRTARYAARFIGRYTHRTVPGGIGHNLPQEAPGPFADAVLEVGGW
jgi:pimeloyl-ACP methyl ester carboxylesterase